MYKDRVRIVPLPGEEFLHADNDSHFKCLASDADLDQAVLQNLRSGWTFTAHHIGMYADGFIDWAFSTGGHFA